MIVLRIKDAKTRETVFSRLVIPDFTKLQQQGIVGSMKHNRYGFAHKTVVNAAKICDSGQRVRVTTKRKDCLLTLINTNFNKPNRLESAFDDPKTIDINLKIVDKSKEVENLKNILEIAEGRKPKFPKREAVVLDIQFVSRPWKPIELFEAMEGYGFDDKEVWSVFELMRDSEEIVQFQMENEEHRLTISDFRNPPYFPPRLGGVKW